MHHSTSCVIIRNNIYYLVVMPMGPLYYCTSVNIRRMALYQQPRECFSPCQINTCAKLLMVYNITDQTVNGIMGGGYTRRSWRSLARSEGRKRRGQSPCVTACVRPDGRREFSTDEKGCASEQSGTDKGSASAGTVLVQQRDKSKQSIRG